MKKNDNELSGINTKENVQKRTRAKIIISSDSELSSNASEANIFQKKIATQKSSTSTKSLCIGTKTKTHNVDLTMIDSDDDDDLISNGHAEQSDDRKGTQKLKEQKKKNIKKIHENNNDDIKKWEGLVSRANSNSSSDKEFSRHKIIHSYVSLQRISDIEKDYTVSPAQSLSPSPPSNSTLSKQDAFVLKNHVHKFFLEMKQSIKKLENKIEFIERNYHYKQKLKRKDATRMMMECTRMIRDWKQHVNTSEDKVVNRYNTWCKKARVKNIFINKSHVSNDIDTPNRYKEKINKSILIPSSDSDSDKTVVDYPIIHKSSSMHSIRSHDGAQAVDEVRNQEQNNQPENIIERNSNRNKILDSSDESDVELRNVSSAHGQCVNEINDDNVRDLSPIRNVDKSINNSENSPIQQAERSSTPESKLDSNLNFDYSPQSSIDMFQDDNEIENNEENSLPPMSTEAQIHELPAKKNSSPNNKFINEDNNEKEKEKSKKTIALDDSSSGSDDKILPESNKKSRLSSTDEKKENQDKPPKKQSSEAKEKSIDNCNDESLVINNNPIDNDSSVDDNEEQARKALLDSSSDSEPEALFNISNEDNNLLLEDDELSDNDNIINDKTKEQRESHKSRTSLNNCLISAKSKNIKFILRNNVHYKNDMKLRYVTTVELLKLGKNILSQHSNALKESKEYLENKQVKRYIEVLST